jgi:ribosome biogenesis GTPase A
MRVKYIFSSRRTRHTENLRKQRKKYPAILDILINASDIVLEVLDARFIEDTRNLDIEKQIEKKGKKLIYVLNKADLINSKKSMLSPVVFVSCKNRAGIKELRDKIKETAKAVKKPIDKDLGKIIVGVIGYPNTGKSSLINLLVGRNVAKTGADAGFTKGLQKLRLSEDIILLDSPGVIPKIEYSSDENKKIAMHTKVGGRSYSQVKDPEIVIASLMQEFPGILQEHYGIKTQSSEHLIEKLGRHNNFLKKGNQVDDDKVSRFILREWQQGKIKVD